MIQLANLSAGYGGQDVLQDISLTLRPGQVTAIIGPNGCGKSTLLKTAVGILSPSAGTILLSGEDARSLSTAERARRVAYLPQNRRAPDISVLRMVLHGRFPYLNYPRRYRPEDITAAKDALRQTGLGDLQDELVSRLSGGMQQAVYIAMALAQDTDTILMDEPTTFLDAAHQLRLLNMARQLADGGKAVALVLHDLSHALRTADTVSVMQTGRLVCTGTPEEVFASGILEQVFGVRVGRYATEHGWQYYCASAEF